MLCPHSRLCGHCRLHSLACTPAVAAAVMVALEVAAGWEVEGVGAVMTTAALAVVVAPVQVAVRRPALVVVLMM